MTVQNLHCAFRELRLKTMLVFTQWKELPSPIWLLELIHSAEECVSPMIPFPDDSPWLRPKTIVIIPLALAWKSTPRKRIPALHCNRVTLADQNSLHSY